MATEFFYNYDSAMSDSSTDDEHGSNVVDISDTLGDKTTSTYDTPAQGMAPDYVIKKW